MHWINEGLITLTKCLSGAAQGTGEPKDAVCAGLISDKSGPFGPSVAGVYALILGMATQIVSPEIDRAEIDRAEIDRAKIDRAKIDRAA